MHEYLRDTLVSLYEDCKHCKCRSQFTCIKCGFCWSCHWKQEELEKLKIWSQGITNAFHPSFLKNNYSESTEYKMEKSQLEIGDYKQVMVTTVFGEVTEPICNYRRCHHSFSMHGLNNHICQCQHPQNLVVGVTKKLR
jgi:hypothetical protein